MLKPNLNNTHKQLIILIIIFLFGFISLFTLNKFFLGLTNQLDKQTNQLEIKMKIAEVISLELVKIKSLFHEIATTTNSERTREPIIDKVIVLVDSVNQALDVMENGGTFTREIKLNVEGHLSSVQTLYYERPNSDEIELESIDIRPKIAELPLMIADINQILEQRTKYKNTNDLIKFSKSVKTLRRYYKTLPAYFSRLLENHGRFLFEGQKELEGLKFKIKADKVKYQKLKLYLILTIILIVLVFGYIIVKKVARNSKELYKLNINLNDSLEQQAMQQESTRAILDTQPNIILVNDGQTLIEANNRFLQFFNKYKTIEEFKEENSCICDFFEPHIDNKNYIDKKIYGDMNWMEYIIENPKRHFKVIIKKDNIEHHFGIKVTQNIINQRTGTKVIITTLNDITKEVNSQRKLKNLNDNLELIVENKTKELRELNDNLEEKIIVESIKARKKDKQLIEQSRFASLGEMIGNIAHQWRQPLSAISSTASSMQLQIQLGLTNDKEIDTSYSKIIEYTTFLTQTIEDFRGFANTKKDKIEFNIEEVIVRVISLTSATYKNLDINLIHNPPANHLVSYGVSNELSQVFLNILSNAKDALVSKNVENKTVIIKYEMTENENIIYIQDNAGGIHSDIIHKIFDPYFTTKHQSQGTGIGLYMSKDIIENHLKGVISVENITTTLDNQSYSGACFKIILPIIQ